MARIIVRSERDHSILMNELVLPDHLDSDQSALQFLERLAWAIEDADGEHRQKRKIVSRQTAASRRPLRRPR